MEKQVALAPAAGPHLPPERGLKRMKKPIVKGTLLFHPTHGLCRVALILGTAESKEVSYSLLPVARNSAKVRFIVPQSSLENSGFSKLISAKEANAILEYFKTGAKKDSECSPTWTLAVVIWSESCSKESAKDTRRRQRVERSVKGLAGELAVVLKINLKEITEKIQKNLGNVSTINPLVLTALANVDRD